MVLLKSALNKEGKVGKEMQFNGIDKILANQMERTTKFICALEVGTSVKY